MLNQPFILSQNQHPSPNEQLVSSMQTRKYPQGNSMISSIINILQQQKVQDDASIDEVSFNKSSTKQICKVLPIHNKPYIKRQGFRQIDFSHHQGYSQYLSSESELGIESKIYPDCIGYELDSSICYPQGRQLFSHQTQSIYQDQGKCPQYKVQVQFAEASLLLQESLLLQKTNSQIIQISHYRNNLQQEHQKHRISSIKSIYISENPSNQLYHNFPNSFNEEDQTLIKLLFPQSHKTISQELPNLNLYNNHEDGSLCSGNFLFNVNLNINVSILNPNLQVPLSQMDKIQQRDKYKVDSVSYFNQQQQQHSQQQQPSQMINEIYHQALALIQEQQQSDICRFRDRLIRAKHQIQRKSIRQQPNTHDNLNIIIDINEITCQGNTEDSKPWMKQLNQHLTKNFPKTHEGRQIMSCVRGLFINKVNKFIINGNKVIEEVDSDEDNNRWNENGQVGVDCCDIFPNQKQCKQNGQISNVLLSERNSIPPNSLEDISQKYQKIINELINDHQTSTQKLKLQYHQLLQTSQLTISNEKNQLNEQILSLKNKLEQLYLQNLEKDQQIENWQCQIKQIISKNQQDLKHLEKEYRDRIQDLEIRLSQTNEEVDRLLQEKDIKFQQKLTQLISESNKDIQDIRKEADQQVIELRKELCEKCQQLQDLQDTIQRQYSRFNLQIQHKTQKLLEKDRQLQQISNTHYHLEQDLLQMKRQNSKLMRNSQIFNEEVINKDQLIDYLKFQLQSKKEYLNDIIQAKLQVDYQLLALQETNRTLRNQILGYLSRQTRQREMYEDIARLKVRIRNYENIEKSATINTRLEKGQPQRRKKYQPPIQYTNKDRQQNHHNKHRQKAILETLMSYESLDKQILKEWRIKCPESDKSNDDSKNLSFKGNQNTTLNQTKPKKIEKQDIITKKYENRHAIKIDRDLEEQIDNQLQQLRKKKDKYRQGIYSPRQYRRQDCEREEYQVDSTIHRWKSSQNLGKALSKYDSTHPINNIYQRWQKPQRQDTPHKQPTQDQPISSKKTPTKGFNPISYDLFPSQSGQKQFTTLDPFKTNTKLGNSRQRSFSSASFQMQ